VGCRVNSTGAQPLDPAVEVDSGDPLNIYHSYWNHDYSAMLFQTNWLDEWSNLTLSHYSKYCNKLAPFEDLMISRIGNI
jgi:hypothetical protein